MGALATISTTAKDPAHNQNTKSMKQICGHVSSLFMVKKYKVKVRILADEDVPIAILTWRR